MKAPTDKLDSPRNTITVAVSANANATALVNVRVFFCELVAAFAMRLSGAGSEWTGSALNYVDTLRYRFEVVWIHARRIATQMVNYKAIWNWSALKLIGDAVRRGALAHKPEMAVAVSVGCTSPYPARTAFSDFAPKTGNGIAGIGALCASARLGVSVSQMRADHGGFVAAFAPTEPQGHSVPRDACVFQYVQSSEFLASKINRLSVHGGLQ